MALDVESNISLTPQTKILHPVDGYNEIADFYDQWYWNDFWNTNEAPHVIAFLEDIPDGTVLDAGCGTGRYRPAIERRGLRYIGVDISNAMLEINAQKFLLSLTYPPALLYAADLRACPVTSGTLDGILCTRTLSHIEDLPTVFGEFRRMLHSEGLCIITDVHSDHPYEHTSIPGINGKVSIETFKWTPEEISTSVQVAGEFELVYYREFALDQLCSQPDRAKFGKLYAWPKRKIFYVLVLRKR